MGACQWAALDAPVAHGRCDRPTGTRLAFPGGSPDRGRDGAPATAALEPRAGLDLGRGSHPVSRRLARGSHLPGEPGPPDQPLPGPLPAECRLPPRGGECGVPPDSPRVRGDRRFARSIGVRYGVALDTGRLEPRETPPPARTVARRGGRRGRAHARPHRSQRARHRTSACHTRRAARPRAG